ncbi:hypothetical protein C0J52_07857, partial [Blattella germanica]
FPVFRVQPARELPSVRGSHRSSGFHWTVGLRYFLIPLATGVMIFGTGYVKEEWRQYCLGGHRKSDGHIDDHREIKESGQFNLTNIKLCSPDLAYDQRITTHPQLFNY